MSKFIVLGIVVVGVLAFVGLCGVVWFWSVTGLWDLNSARVGSGRVYTDGGSYSTLGDYLAVTENKFKVVLTYVVIYVLFWLLYPLLVWGGRVLGKKFRRKV